MVWARAGTHLGPQANTLDTVMLGQRPSEKVSRDRLQSPESYPAKDVHGVVSVGRLGQPDRRTNDNQQLEPVQLLAPFPVRHITKQNHAAYCASQCC